jgi:uracil-DNA glycosylase family 4
MTECPSCGAKILTPTGKSGAPLLVVGEAPGTEELRRGAPWTHQAGEILRAEFTRAGIALSDCRFTNLWFHAERKKKDDLYEGCYNFCMGDLLDEFCRARAVLLCGAGPVEMLTGKKVGAVNGLIVQARDPFPTRSETVLCVAAVSPASVITGVVGDFRFAVTKFAEYTKDLRKEYYAQKNKR